jgi:hypothetical protein
MHLVVLVISVPIAVIAGAVLASYLARRSLATKPESFRCWLGPPAAPGTDRAGAADRATDSPRLYRRALRAVWVHDALVLVGGRIVTTIRPLAVRFADGEVHRISHYRRRRSGGELVVLTLELDDGSRVPLAAEPAAAARLAGPYLAALVPRGTDASAERRPGT